MIVPVAVKVGLLRDGDGGDIIEVGESSPVESGVCQSA